MAKKNSELEAKILQTAGRLFLEIGYTDLDMKTIANAVGTSVGNLYNYFPSKTALFQAGSVGWWEQIRQNFDQRISAMNSPREKLEALFLEVFETLETRVGLWEEFLASSSRELSKEEATRLREKLRVGAVELISKVDELLHEMAVEDSKLKTLLKAPGKRVATCLVSQVKTLTRFYPQEKETNRRFLSEVIDAFLN